MEKKCKIFIPWENSFKIQGGFVKLDHDYKNKCYYFKPNKKPFFSLLNENFTPKGFIEAVKKNNTEDAESYLSKALGYGVDLEAIKGIFKADYNYKYLVEVKFKQGGLQKIKSVMVTDEKSRFKGIIHFYLVKEPDSFSNWKIFKIVKE